METIISLFIVLGIPIIFLILCIKNIIRIVKTKKDNDTVKKSLIIKSVIFGIIFILIIIFYIWIIHSLSQSIVNNM